MNHPETFTRVVFGVQTISTRDEDDLPPVCQIYATAVRARKSKQFSAYVCPAGVQNATVNSTMKISWGTVIHHGEKRETVSTRRGFLNFLQWLSLFKHPLLIWHQHEQRESSIALARTIQKLNLWQAFRDTAVGFVNTYPLIKNMYRDLELEYSKVCLIRKVFNPFMWFVNEDVDSSSTVLDLVYILDALKVTNPQLMTNFCSVDKLEPLLKGFHVSCPSSRNKKRGWRSQPGVGQSNASAQSLQGSCNHQVSTKKVKVRTCVPGKRVPRLSKSSPCSSKKLRMPCFFRVQKSHCTAVSRASRCLKNRVKPGTTGDGVECTSEDDMESSDEEEVEADLSVNEEPCRSSSPQETHGIKSDVPENSVSASTALVCNNSERVARETCQVSRETPGTKSGGEEEPKLTEPIVGDVIPSCEDQPLEESASDCQDGNNNSLPEQNIISEFVSDSSVSDSLNCAVVGVVGHLGEDDSKTDLYSDNVDNRTSSGRREMVADQQHFRLTQEASGTQLSSDEEDFELPQPVVEAVLRSCDVKVEFEASTTLSLLEKSEANPELVSTSDQVLASRVDLKGDSVSDENAVILPSDLCLKVGECIDDRVSVKVEPDTDTPENSISLPMDDTSASVDIDNIEVARVKRGRNALSTDIVSTEIIVATGLKTEDCCFNTGEIAEAPKKNEACSDTFEPSVKVISDGQTVKVCLGEEIDDGTRTQLEDRRTTERSHRFRDRVGLPLLRRKQARQERVRKVAVPPVLQPVGEHAIPNNTECTGIIFASKKQAWTSDQHLVLSQLSAVCGKDKFDFIFESSDSLGMKAGLQMFLDWLRKYQAPLLLISGGFCRVAACTFVSFFDVCGLLANFETAVIGFADHLSAMRSSCSDNAIHINRIQNLPNPDCLARVTEEQALLEKIGVTTSQLLRHSFQNKFIMFHFKSSRNFKTIKPLVDSGVLSIHYARKIADSGLQLTDLWDTFQMHGTAGLLQMLGPTSLAKVKEATFQGMVRKIATYFHAQRTNSEIADVDDIEL